MRKIAIQGLLLLFATALFVLVYYGFFTYPKYSGKAQFIPFPIISIFMLVLFLVVFFYGKYLLNVKIIHRIGLSVSVVVLLLLISIYIDYKYSHVLEHYYQRFPYTNLLHLSEYSKQPGNFMTVNQSLKKDGIQVHSLVEGSTDNLDSEIRGTSFSQMIYYVNEAFYVIFDWKKEIVVTSVDRSELTTLMSNKLDEKGSIIYYEGNFVTFKSELGETTNYKIVPVDNDFDFVDLSRSNRP